MKLSQLTISNFRSCESVSLCLSEDLTVMVGENASGKSAIIDAIRLSTTPAIEGSGLAFSADYDPTKGTDGNKEVKISSVYDELTATERAIYLAQLVDPDDRLMGVDRRASNG
ncbi:AAA family ATPase [Mycolicibacterium phlei]|uniref:AAA family ATPase n=1 Tax=Mycolicibacterium phlei TaxID=1771 RepID=UPI0009D9D426|nr:AAA family ATPase [Mycolicibacterium phlei]